jgi:hypothetical protein
MNKFNAAVATVAVVAASLYPIVAPMVADFQTLLSAM